MTDDPEAGRAQALGLGQVCYLQPPAASRDRAAAFYQAVFGWQVDAHAPDFEAPGLIGQWAEGRPSAPDAGPMIWLAPPDMSDTPKRVQRHGCESLHPPTPPRPVRTRPQHRRPEGN